MNRVIELFEKELDGEGNVKLIAECNDYLDNVRVQQLSRSPFTYPSTISDDDIINDLKTGTYSIYF